MNQFHISPLAQPWKRPMWPQLISTTVEIFLRTVNKKILNTPSGASVEQTLVLVVITGWVPLLWAVWLPTTSVWLVLTWSEAKVILMSVLQLRWLTIVYSTCAVIDQYYHPTSIEGKTVLLNISVLTIVEVTTSICDWSKILNFCDRPINKLGDNVQYNFLIEAMWKFSFSENIFWQLASLINRIFHCWKYR